MIEEFRHERRHSRIEIGGAAHHVQPGELRSALTGQERENLFAQRRCRLRRAQHSHHGDASLVEDRMPPRLGTNRLGRKPGLLRKLAQHAALEIDAFADHVVGIRRAADEIHFSGVGGVAGHDAEHEGAVGGAQRTHREAIAHALVGKAPVAPCQKAGEIGFQICAAEHAVGDGERLQQQNPAVPQFGLAAPQFREIAIDLVPTLGRKRPRRPGEPQLEPLDRNESDVGHDTSERGFGRKVQASIVPSQTTTASPAIAADASFPCLIEIESSIRLGRPIS